MVTTKYKYKNSNDDDDNYNITAGHPGFDDDDNYNITMMTMRVMKTVVIMKTWL